MRWTQNDTLAYRAVTDMADRFKQAGLERDLRQASESDPTGGFTPEVQQNYEGALRAYSAPDNGLSEADRLAGLEATARAYDAQPRRQWSPGEIEGYRAGRMGEVLARSGDWKGAMQMRQSQQGLEAGELQKQATQQAMELGGYKIKEAKRGAKQATLEDSLLALRREAPGLSDEEFFSRASQLASDSVPDGKGFTYQLGAAPGSAVVSMHDRDSRKIVGAKPMTRDEVLNHLWRYSSTAAANEADKQDFEEKKYKEGLSRYDQDRTSREKEGALDRAARLKEAGIRASALTSNADGYELAALTEDNKPVYRMKGKIGLFTDDGKGGAVRYTGDVSRLKGIGANPVEKEAKPTITFEKFVELFPSMDAKGRAISESAEDAYRRYLKFQNPQPSASDRALERLAAGAADPFAKAAPKAGLMPSGPTRTILPNGGEAWIGSDGKTYTTEAAARSLGRTADISPVGQVAWPNR